VSDVGRLIQGENLTESGLDPHFWRAGQRYRVGEAVIELTTLRQPCGNLTVYGASIKPSFMMRDAKTAVWIRRSGRAVDSTHAWFVPAPWAGDLVVHPPRSARRHCRANRLKQ
jgi:hypothetical protein